MFGKKLFWLLFLFSILARSQTSVSGLVLDESGLPIPYANLFFKNSQEGTTTREDGRFTLISEKKHTLLVISYIGYTTEEIKLSQETTKGLKIILKESGEQLEEVIVINKPKKSLSKKENPAYKILQKIWKNKNNNRLNTTKGYQYKKYTATELALNNLDSSFLKKIVKKSYDTIVKIAQQDKTQKSFNLPIYWSEKLEFIYGNNLLNKERIDVQAERDFGITQEGFGLERITSSIKKVNIYNNNIQILDKSFVSPISSSGYSFYHYVLQDSIVSDLEKFYTIYFFPKQDGDLGMQGNFIVSNNKYAITEISMKLNKDVNLNFIRNLFIEKKYRFLDNVYIPTLDTYECDFSFLTKDEEEKGLTFKKEIKFYDFVLNKIKRDKFYSKNNTKIKPNQFKKTNAFWNRNLPEGSTIQNTKTIVAALKNNKRIKNIARTINIVTSGYIKLFKPIELGSLWTTFAKNDIEGLRLRIGFRNFSSSNDRFRTNMFAAYGTKDKKAKYGIEAKYLLSYKPRIVIGSSYMNDFEQMGSRLLQENDLLPYNFGNISLFNRGENYTLTHNKRASFNLDIGIHNNFHISLSSVYQKINTAFAEKFSIDYKNPTTGQISSEINDFITNIAIIYTPKRNIFGFGVEQKKGKNLYSKTIVKYGKGIKGIAGSQFNYDKIQASYYHPILLGRFGRLNINIEAGTIFGTVPLPLLHPVVANQTYSLVPNTFALLDYFDFVTDTYVATHLEHHFNGILMNRVPLIKKLKLRTLGFYRGVNGSISKKNIKVNQSSINYNAPIKLYHEYGFGIENIGYGNIRPFRIDFIWRSDFKDINGPTTPKFGIRIGINPEF